MICARCIFAYLENVASLYKDAENIYINSRSNDAKKDLENDHKSMLIVGENVCE